MSLFVYVCVCVGVGSGSSVVVGGAAAAAAAGAGGGGGGVVTVSFRVFAVLVVVMFIVVVAAAAAACCSLFADVAALVAFGFALAVGTQDWARSKHDTMENCRSGLATAWRPSASRWFWFRSVGRVLERALGY